MDLSSTPPPPHAGTSTPPATAAPGAIIPTGHDSAAAAAAALSQNHPHQHQPQNGAGTGYSSPNRQPKKSSATCTTCRARKVRCNGTRPVCSNCQRLGFPCSYDDDSTDPAAAAAAWSVALPRRRVKQACLSCHSRKARCSGHMPACDRCRAQGIECVYRPTKRARVSTKGGVGGGSAGRDSPQSHDDDSHRDDGHGDSDSGFPDMMGDAMGDGHTGGFGHDAYVPDSSLGPPSWLPVLTELQFLPGRNFRRSHRTDLRQILPPRAPHTHVLFPTSRVPAGAVPRREGR